MHPVFPRPLEGSGADAALDLLTPPFAAAAGRDVVPLDGGRLEVPGPRRQPVVLVRLKTALARTAVVVRAAAGDTELPPVVFTAHSEAGSVLPLYVPRPGVDAAELNGAVVPSFALDVRVWRVEGAAAYDDAQALAAVAGEALPDDDAAELVDGAVLDGTMARVVLLGALEKQRLVAAGREVAASRHVSMARAGALDALGADAGVPRLPEEDDDAYRARLAIYSSWRTATPAGLAAALNGPGAPGDPSAGLPAAAGITARFRIDEVAGPLAIAVRLVEVGGPVPRRDRFAALLTGGLLFDLDRDPPAELPEATRERWARVRDTLTTGLVRASGRDAPRYLGVLTATSLDRVVRVLHLLTGDGSMRLLRAWTAGPDPRHELGLGVTISPLKPARLDDAAAAVAAAQTAAAAGEPVELPGAGGPADPELLALVLGMTPRDTGADPLGEWLFTAAGMATVAADDRGGVYLSPLPTQGLVIEGPAAVAPGATAEYVAHLRAGSGTGRHVLVDEVWQRARGPFAEVGAEIGEEDPVPLAPDDLRAALEDLAATGPALPEAFGALAAAGLAPVLPGDFAARLLEAYDLDLLIGVPVDDDGGGGDEGEFRDRMIARADALTGAGFHSVRVLPRAGGGALVLASLSAVPGGANRPGEPPPAAYRWYVTEVPAPPSGAGAGEVLVPQRRAGGRVAYRARRSGLVLVVCVGYVRRGAPDPYEVRIDLPDGEVISLEQYGYVMNLLEHLCPIGIEINTFGLRRRHVSVDGGEPVFLSGRVSRSYTRYRRRRPTTRR